MKKNISLCLTCMLRINLIILLITISLRSIGQHTLLYHPNSPARIGSGYDSKFPEQIFAVSCIESEGIENIDNQNGIVDGNIVIKEIKDRKELFQTMGVSLALEASYGLANGSTSISKNISLAFESTSLIWVASVELNFGRFRLKNPHASINLLNAPNPNDVIRICGSEIFTQEIRGAKATVIFEMRGLKNSEKEELLLALSFAASNPGASVSSDLRYKNAINKLQETSQLNIYVNVQGGPGPSYLSQIFENPSDLNVIRTTLKNYINNTNSVNAKPLSYQTSPISQFKNLSFTIAPDLNQDRLIEIYDYYINLTSLIRRIDDLIKPTSENDKILNTFVTEVKRQELQIVRNKYDSVRTNLRDAGVACLKNTLGCELPLIANLPRIEWPEIPEIPKVIGVKKCELHLLAVTNHQQVKGELTGYNTYQLALTGNNLLFKSAKLITTDSEIPLIISDNFEFEKDTTLLLNTMEKCTERTFDKSKTFGFIKNLFLESKHEIPLGKIQIIDIYGRAFFYNLDNF